MQPGTATPSALFFPALNGGACRAPMVTNGNFANDQFPPWESPNITPEFRADDGTGRSLWMPAKTLIRQKLNPPAERRQLKVRGQFKARIESRADIATNVIILVTASENSAPADIDALLASGDVQQNSERFDFKDLTGQWATYDIIGHGLFPAEERTWFITIVNSRVVGDEGKLAPILITDIELYPLYLEG